MRFNSKVVDVFTRLSGVSQSLIFKWPYTVITSEDKSFSCRVNIGEIDREEFQPFGIYMGLSDFLSSFKLFGPDRKVSLENSIINIYNDNSSISYVTDDMDYIKKYDIDPAVFDRIKEFQTVAEWETTEEDLKTLKSSFSVLKSKNVDEMRFIASGSKVTLKSAVGSKFSNNSSSFSKRFNAVISREFEVSISSENFILLPNGNYKYQVKYNESKDAYKILAIGENIECLIALKV